MTTEEHPKVIRDGYIDKAERYLEEGKQQSQFYLDFSRDPQVAREKAQILLLSSIAASLIAIARKP